MIEDFFTSVIQNHTNNQYLSYQTVGGGCINSAARIKTEKLSYFIKWNTIDQLDLFEKEAEGLEYLEAHSSIRIPKVLGKGTHGNKAYLLLEWIEKGHVSQGFWHLFGSRLAELHKVTSNHFGFEHDNHIGRLPQSNRQYLDWFEFFISERLQPQIKMASNSGLISQTIETQFETLFKELPSLIPNEKPALLHGDLWSGNFMTDANSHPVLIDPAVHFGHRETELAFTTLFGGFDQSFYNYYRRELPLEPGFEDRIDLHNLYPLLVHVNLFGTSYLSGIQQTLKRHT